MSKEELLERIAMCQQYVSLGDRLVGVMPLESKTAVSDYKKALELYMMSLIDDLNGKKDHQYCDNMAIDKEDLILVCEHILDDLKFARILMEKFGMEGKELHFFTRFPEEFIGRVLVKLDELYCKD